MLTQHSDAQGSEPNTQVYFAEAEESSAQR